MEYKSHPKPNSHDANTRDEICSSGHSCLLGPGTRTNETVSDKLVHVYTPVGVTREPVGGLHHQLSTEDNATSYSKPDTVHSIA